MTGSFLFDVITIKETSYGIPSRRLPMELILIIVVLVLLFGGGGYWGRRRGHW
jgi:hypothetical protein